MTSMSKKKKYYVVWKGIKPGIYDSWAECQAQIKGVQGALYKSFTSEDEALQALVDGAGAHVGKGSKSSSSISKIKGNLAAGEKAIVWNSISVDAACAGNPGVTEYQGVDTKSKKRIFHKKFDLGTNNIGEFLAIVHALALFKNKGFHNTPIYTDSRTAMAWVRNKKVKTTLEKTPQTAELYMLIERAETWLKNNTWSNELLKWDTKKWGEIPADFGRK